MATAPAQVIACVSPAGTHTPRVAGTTHTPCPVATEIAPVVP